MDDETVLRTFPFSSLLFTALLITFYLSALKIIRYFMLNRDPFDLHNFIIAYNVYQILACATFMNILVKSGVKFWRVYCPETWYMEPQLQYDIGRFGFWLKASEMIETFVFLLRKKNGQVTKLHLFHHCITVTFLYFSVAYDFKSGGYLALFINSLVHVIMYSYYLASTLFSGSRVLSNFKPVITVIQITQFVIVLCQILLHKVFMGCEYPMFFTFYYFFGFGALTVFFLDFYRKTYKK
ncbi:hypothetical protein ACFFRR_011455 [Megaselia abdita]